MSQIKDLIIKLATQFINIPADSIDEHIHETLGMAGTYLGMDRAYLFEYDLEKGTMTNTYEWCGEGIKPFKDRLQNIPLSSYPKWIAQHFAGEIIRIPSVKDLSHGNLKKTLEMQGIKSLITVPLMDHGKCLGFVGLDAVRREINWNEDHVCLARMIAEIYRNVIKRRNMEKRLAATQRQYEELVDGIPVGLYRRKPGPGGEFIMVNKALARILGFESKEELIGVKIARFCVDMERMKQCAAELALTGEIKEKEVRFSKRDGKIFWAAISAKEYVDEAGNPVYVEGLVQDISDRKKEEEEKERLRSQLQQAQRLESIGRLAGGVAHDFNNLLVPILGYSELLLEMAGDDERLRRYVSPIKEAGEKARDIVRQLLAFGRKQELEKTAVELNEHVSKFRKFLVHTLRDDIEVVVKSSSEPIVVECDVRQLDQVFLNLAINAQDAMPDGGRLEITTGVKKLDKTVEGFGSFLHPGTYAVLTIRDTGVGMDSKTLEQIFEPFFTTKSMEKGTGLGLAMAYGIVQQHGGNIRVESRPSEGSTFQIFLPLFSGKIKSGGSHSSSSGSTKGGGTILIVEDEPAVRDFVAHALGKDGYKVIKAGAYKDVVEILESMGEPPDLLLTDVIMPGVNGIEMYRRLKEDYPSLKVLYMSGNAPETVHLEEEENFLQKPFSVKDLRERIRAVLDEKDVEDRLNAGSMGLLQ